MFTKLRFKFEIFFRYFQRNWIFILLGLIVGILLVVFRQSLINFYFKINQNIQKIGIEGQYNLTNLPTDISNKISYGLTTLGENNKFEPSILVKSLDIRQDNTQFVFELNPDIKWHKGKKFTASDINYKIQGLTITSPDAEHLTIQSDSAFAPIMASLSRPIIKKNFEGLGEYKVTRFDYQDGYLKELHLKSIDSTIYYRFYQNENDLLNAFKIGEVNQVEISSIPDNLKLWPKTSITKNIHTDEKYIALFINTQKLNSKQLRQALAYATPKTSDLNERAISPISPLSWAYNPDVKDYNYNPTKAKEFFSKNKIDSIDLAFNDRRLVNLADNIKKSWEEVLGLKVNAHISPQIDTQNYDVILAYGSIPTDPDQYLYWHSTQSKSNLTKINNPRIDKLLEEGRQSFDQQERKKIYQEFQKILLEECPAIFLEYPTLYTISRDN